MDPAEVRRFAEELKRFNQDLQNGITLLQARFAALGETWQDQEHAKFAEEFRQTMTLLDEWKAPEPSPYFDLRLHAHLREEMERAHAGSMHWFRRPVLAASSLLYAAGLAGIGFAPTLPVYLLAWVVLGAGMGTGLYDAVFAALGKLYGKEARTPITCAPPKGCARR